MRLGDVTPSFSFDDRRNGRLVDSVFSGDRGLLTRLKSGERSNLHDILGLQLRHRSSLDHLVGNIVSVSTQKKVFRTDTRRIVATVANNHALGDGSKGQSPRNAVGLIDAAADAEAPVPILRGRLPFPAIRSLLNLGPEAIRNREGKRTNGLQRRAAAQLRIMVHAHAFALGDTWASGERATDELTLWPPMNRHERLSLFALEPVSGAQAERSTASAAVRKRARPHGSYRPQRSERFPLQPLKAVRPAKAAGNRSVYAFSKDTVTHSLEILNLTVGNCQRELQPQEESSCRQ